MKSNILKRGYYKALKKSIIPGYTGVHNTLFIHIPKTGGLSIAQSFFGYSSKHYRLCDYSSSNNKVVRNVFSFAMVRHPVDRLISAYNYLKKGGINDNDRNFFEKELSGYEDFNSFVVGWLSRKNALKYIHFHPQHTFVNSTGNIGDKIIKASFIGSFENFENDTAYIKKFLAIDRQIKHINKNNSNLGRSALPEPILKIIKDVYTEDFDLFGYE